MGDKEKKDVLVAYLRYLQVEQYNNLGNSKNAWVSTADNLIDASEFLCLNEHDKHPTNKAVMLDHVGQMLRGMALECWFKGLYVGAGGTLAKDGKFKGIRGLNNHNLETLAEKVAEKLPSLNIHNNERSLLKRLSLKIVMGRYPIHINADKTKPQKAGAGFILPLNFLFREDIKAFKSILVKLRALD